ncbi:unnamed protein product [Didymodactylos carnosus]|uniref:Uncharacterized protein n=1 Tax=Didymodactylos carnosus TaxID=1234261 RepID=A0A814BNW6_9BILA|nr:unnamed protein product [Didymodactylos carnosus]CAF0930395.1 unnamed protein product [Didymodactylos carnosus]CAF3661440.1 unnamed protein product [Didymodactylos carnosus]CAF3708424.1 unnamed protein product [Didymodactylos carnosus]
MKRSNSYTMNQISNGTSSQTPPKSEEKILKGLFKKPKDEDDNEKLSPNEKKQAPTVSFLSLFRYATRIDVFYYILATIAGLASGAAFPLLLLIFGNLTDTFTNPNYNFGNLTDTLGMGGETDICKLNQTIFNYWTTKFCVGTGINLTASNFLSEYSKCDFPGVGSDFTDKIREQSLYLVIIGAASIVVVYFQVAFFSIAGERQTRRIREELFRSVLNKQIAYFDMHKTGELNTRLSDDINKIHDGISDKLGSALQFTSAFITGVILAFIKVTAVFSLGQAAPHFQSHAQARGAAFTVWEIIDTPSAISSNSEEGFKGTDLVGDVLFDNVDFTYPSRADVPVLNKLSFSAQRGQTIALVGSSGCGKSTCIQLLQRFYDPIAGSVQIDGRPVNEYNLRWLRQHIGVVSQEPILFATTISENIKYGRDSATEKEIMEAAKKANAHDFIMLLPNDNESETIVQDALDRASSGRTTIVVAHRLSTIRNADKIIVISEGQVVEEGDHATLMKSQSTYYALVEAQNLRSKTADDDQDDDDLLERRDTVHSNRALSITDSKFATVSIMDDKKIDDSLDKKQAKRSSWTIMLTMLKMNRPELCFIIWGCVACLCNGGIQPAFGVILAKIIAVFQECDLKVQEKNVTLYVIMFIIFAFLMLITMFLQSFLFACSGEALTQRLRAKTFQSMLRQEVAWFDLTDNNTGALCTRLSTEASDVQGATGIRIGTILQNIANLGVGIILAFIYGWALTLVVLAFVPFMIIAGFLQTYLLTGFATKSKKVLEDAGKIAVESIQNIRTVAQLTKEQRFGDDYCRLLDIPFKNSIKRAHIFAILFSTTNSIMFFAQAALFSFGAYMVEKGKMEFEDVMLVLNCILFGAMAVGQTASMTPDYGKAVASAEKILQIFERTPEIDNSSTTGEKIDNFRGEILFDSVSFHYPNRPEVTVLEHLTLKIKPGQQVALVGSSGCGKSTSIQLLERFYDPSEGGVHIDSKDIRNLNLQWYRSQIGIVSQEPVLFDLSIAENIAYGDNSRTVNMEEIIEAAKNANIDTFISSLPKGYNTNIGTKGTQLSGGQKQRIAIARALIRNPAILLLDEATSALDTESEKVVQDALDRAQQNRTSLTIAHRLSTIQNADLICVLKHGKIVESGTHDELVNKKGLYYKLAQSKLK